jgi:hypothetical protein
VDSFQDKYRKLIEQQAEEAPMDVWNNLSDALDQEMPAEATGESAITSDLEEVWSSMQDQLDIDEVWNNISQELDRDRLVLVRRMVLRWGAAAAIILLFTLPFALQDRPIKKGKLARKEAEMLEMPAAARDSFEGRTDIKQPALMAAQTTTEKAQLSVPLSVGASQEISDEKGETKFYLEVGALIDSAMQNSSIQNGSERLPLLWQSPAIAFIEDFQVDVKPVLVMPENWYEAQFRLPAPEIPQIPGEKDLLVYDRKDSRWTVGVTTVLKNTYLLNQQTIQGFRPEDLTSTKMAFVPDIGLNVKYALNKTYILDANVFAMAQSQQSYMVYQHGEYVSRKVSLNYLQGEWAIKQQAKHSLVASGRVMRRNVAGVYLAQLQNAVEQIDGEGADVGMKYASIDYGILLGQEFEWKAKSPVKLTAGVTVKYGIPNIYTGDDQLPAQLNKTHNASLEFRVGIAYRFKAREGIDHYLGQR